MDTSRLKFVTHFLLCMSAGYWLTISPAQAEDQLSMNALTVHSKTGENLGSSTSQSKMAGFFQAQKELVAHILTQIGIETETLPTEIQADLARPQTTNVKAFIAFSTGLDQLDQGKFVEAKTSFAEAANLDPGFRLAVVMEAAMPEIPTNVAEVTSNAVAGGRKQARAILKKVAAKGDNSDENLGSTNQEAESQEIEENQPPAQNPFEQMLTNQSTASKAVEASQNAASGPTYTSSPICTSGLCGFYAGLLGEGHLETDEEDGMTFTYTKLSILTPTYITEQGVSLTTDGEVTIAQRGGEGYLTGDTSPALANIKAFAEGSTGASGSSSTEPIALKGTVVNDSESGYPSVAAGYYDTCANETTSCNWYYMSSYGYIYDTFSDDGFAGISNGESRYNLFGRLFFAEGDVTPAADLNTLAQDNSTYTYTGMAGGSVLRQSVTYGSTSRMPTSGTFSADLNFSTGKVTNFNTIVSNYDPVSAFNSEDVQVQIQADSANLNSNGSFSIQPNTSGTTFQITAPSYSSTPISMEDGLVSGRTFGSQAAAVGGVFAGHTAPITILNDSETSPTRVYEFSTSGFFAGSRPNATGTIGGADGTTSSTVTGTLQD